MRLGKLKKRAMDAKMIYIRRGIGETWVGTPGGMYLLDAGIEMTTENACALIGIEKRKRDGIEIVEEETFALQTSGRLEQDEPLGTDLVVDMALKEVLVLHDQSGHALGIDRDKLLPVDVDARTYAKRGAYVAVFDEDECVALIMPERLQVMDTILQACESLAEMEPTGDANE